MSATYSLKQMRDIAKSLGKTNYLKLSRQELEDIVAKLEDAKLEDAKLEDAKLEDAKLEDAKLEDTKLEDTKLEDTKLEDTKLEDTKLEEHIQISDSNLSISEVCVLPEIAKQKPVNPYDVPDAISVLTGLDFKKLSNDLQDSVLHGPLLKYHGESFQIAIEEIYQNHHMMRFFVNEKKNKILLFTYVPRGRIGHQEVYDSEIVILNHIKGQQFEMDFEYDSQYNLFGKVLKNGKRVVHRHYEMDSAQINFQTGLFVSKCHRFAAEPLISNYIKVAGEFFLCIRKHYTHKDRICRLFKNLHRSHSYGLLYIEPSSRSMHWKFLTDPDHD
jgi:hypothetical protein